MDPSQVSPSPQAPPPPPPQEAQPEVRRGPGRPRKDAGADAAAQPGRTSPAPSLSRTGSKGSKSTPDALRLELLKKLSDDVSNAWMLAWDPADDEKSMKAFVEILERLGTGQLLKILIRYNDYAEVIVGVAAMVGIAFIKIRPIVLAMLFPPPPPEEAAKEPVKGKDDGKSVARKAPDSGGAGKGKDLSAA